MKLRIQYTGQLRTAVGRSEDELEVPEATTVPVLLKELSVRLGQGAAAHLSTSDGQAPCGLLVVVNGAALAASQAREVRLNAGDVVTLLPPIAGG
jgi:molybdopterin converting factor small subunit